MSRADVSELAGVPDPGTSQGARRCRQRMARLAAYLFATLWAPAWMPVGSDSLGWGCQADSAARPLPRREQDRVAPGSAKPAQGQSEKARPEVKIESVELTAKDGFPLRATWYQGHLGKSAAPLLMLHDIGGSRQDFSRIATYFAENGHCVLVPDWRGHGESRTDPAGRAYQPRRYGLVESLAVQADIEACKKFLIQKNDAEVCNIELMAIVAAGAAGMPALQWSVLDWSYLPAAVKQGQDVKAVVLLSPPRTHQAWQMAPVLRAPLIAGQGHPQPLELMFVVGEQSDVSREVRSMYQQLSGLRGRRDEPDDWAKHNVYLLSTDSSHRGVDLVLQHPQVVPDLIFDFLEYRVFSRAEEYGHHQRSNTRPPVEPPVNDQ